MRRPRICSRFRAARWSPARRWNRRRGANSLEETGLTAGALKQVAVLDIQPEEGHGVAYELHVFGATDPDGVLAPADDAAAAGWFSLEEMLELRLTDSTEEITRELLEGARDA